MKWQKKEVRTSETSEATKRTRNQLARSPFPSSIRQQCIPWEIRKGPLDRPDWPDAAAAGNFCRHSLSLFLSRPFHGFCTGNRRASPMPKRTWCEQGKVRRRSRRAQKVASHRPTYPTLISSHSEIPTSDTGDVATPNTSGVAALCFVWEAGIGAGEEEAIYFMGGVINVVT